MTVTGRQGVLLFAASLIVLAAVAFIVVRDIQARRQHVAFEEALARVDRSAGEESPARTQAMLRRAASAAGSQAQWLSVLKRAVSLAQRSGEWSSALTLADAATADLPGSEALWAVSVYARLRSGNDAAAIAQSHLLSRRFRALRAEALLRSDTDDADREIQGVELAALSRNSAPEEFQRAFQLTDDKRFLVDAALRYAEQGELERALEVAGRADAVEASVYMAYDLGRYDRAQELLRRLDGRRATATPLSLLRADIARRLQDSREALRIYLEVIRTDPKASPVPYRNVLIASQEAPHALPTRFGDPLALALEATRSFPENTSLAAMAAALMYSREPDQVEAFLTERSNHVDAPGTLELLRFHFSEERIPLQARLARLWELWNKHQDPAIARYLAWLAASVRNWSELRRIVADADPGDVPLYAGFLAVRDGNLTQAAEHFQRAADANGSWQARANAAAVLRSLDRLEDAVAVAERGTQALRQQAAAAIPAEGKPAPDVAGTMAEGMAELLYQEAASRAASGQSEAALEAVSQALSHNSSHGGARRLRRRLADARDR